MNYWVPRMSPPELPYCQVELSPSSSELDLAREREQEDFEYLAQEGSALAHHLRAAFGSDYCLHLREDPDSVCDYKSPSLPIHPHPY